MPTPYNDKVKQFIDNYWLKNFRSPNIREVGEHIGIESTGHIRYILDQLGYPGNATARNLIPEWVKKAIREYKGEK